MSEKELPKYKCHKEVYALEIKDITDYRIHFVEDVNSIEIDRKMFSRYVPLIGDFYVIYRNDYKSFSPRKEFLDGYTKL